MNDQQVDQSIFPPGGIHDVRLRWGTRQQHYSIENRPDCVGSNVIGCLYSITSPSIIADLSENAEAVAYSMDHFTLIGSGTNMSDSWSRLAMPGKRMTRVRSMQPAAHSESLLRSYRRLISTVLLGGAGGLIYDQDHLTTRRTCGTPLAASCFTTPRWPAQIVSCRMTGSWYETGAVPTGVVEDWELGIRNWGLGISETI